MRSSHSNASVWALTRPSLPHTKWKALAARVPSPPTPALRTHSRRTATHPSNNNTLVSTHTHTHNYKNALTIIKISESFIIYTTLYNNHVNIYYVMSQTPAPHIRRSVDPSIMIGMSNVYIVSFQVTWTTPPLHTEHTHTQTHLTSEL